MTRPTAAALLPILLPVALWAQSPPSLDSVLARLERLEKENQALRQEVGELRREVASLRPGTAPPAAAGVTAPTAAAPTLEERVGIQERRTEEQAQIKVESAQRIPIRLSGMVLANLYRNSHFAGEQDHPTTASRARGRQSGGITFRQTVVGAEYTGSQTFLGATARASAFLDFYEGNTENTAYYPVRFRTGGVQLDWRTRSLAFQQEKTLIAIRDPETLSYSGVSPLTSAGNLWRWQPQIRFEQHLDAGGSGNFLAQVALVQTNEDSNFPAASGISFARRRPGLEGRLLYSRGAADGRRVEVAPAFHVSRTDAEGLSHGSHVVAVDWLVAPHARLEWSGTAWTGQAVHHFGALRQSFTRVNGVLRPVRAQGGWTQIRVPITPRLSWHTFAGLHDDRNQDLARTAIGVNRSAAMNLMYKLAPNIVVSLEALQQRTTYLDSGNRKNNRYDLSIAYLF